MRPPKKENTGKTSNKKAKRQHKAKRSTSTKQMRKRRHVFVSLINCNEFDSTGGGEEPQEGLTKPQGDRKEAALLLFSCHPFPFPSSPRLMFLKVQEKPSKTVKGFRQRVARQMREHPKEKQQEKKSLKVFCQ